jgi:hypothetical protein
MNGRRGVFTPQNVTLMQQMVDEGSSAREIAMTLGSTAASVRVTCSRLGIRLRRRRGCVPRPVPSSGTLTRDLEMPVVAYMPAEQYAEFARRARAQGKSPGTFASMLLSVIATSDLYKAVLEE